MKVAQLVLLIAAALCFLGAVFLRHREGADHRYGVLVPLGLFFWVCVPFLDHASAMSD